MALVVRGRTGGLASGWHVSSVRDDYFWGCDSGLGMEVFSNELGAYFSLVKVYGPY